MLKPTLKFVMTLAACLLYATMAGAKWGHKSTPPAGPPGPTTAGFTPVSVFDGARDPAKDLQNAIAEATRTNKRILLEVGGDWCLYCNIMDTTFQTHAQLRKDLNTYFVPVKINYSKENPNEAFLSHYPPVPDYPHFIVLDSKGNFLHSQPTKSFEHGSKYNVGKIDTFLKKWGLPERHWLNLEG